MFTKLLLAFTVGHLILSSVVDATNHTGYLEKAVEYLVDYTAAESENILDSLDIKERVSKSAKQQFHAKLGKCCKCNDVITWLCNS